MLSAFGAGCVAAFLLRRFHSSNHTKSACGYALVNWVQAMLGSLGMTTVMDNDYGHRWRSWRTVLVYCRLLLYVIGLLWMQALILSRFGFSGTLIQPKVLQPLLSAPGVGASRRGSSTHSDVGRGLSSIHR